MKARFIALLMVLFFVAATPVAMNADTNEGKDTTKVDYRPKLHGTIRAKYEYQPQISKGRFQVRNARVSIDGNVARTVSYKAEIDLSDEGQIKMLDAFARWKPIDGGSFTIGHMRVPFTIDAHRSPHQQYFANRSFIAKQVGNVRDVGATLGYKFNPLFPITIEFGVFNGSGLTNQKDFWSGQINFSGKLQLQVLNELNVVLSVQKIKPETINIYMYDAGVTWKWQNWTAEAEFLHKVYSGGSFSSVQAVDAFVNYDFMLRKKLLHKISALARFDYMGDHSDGTLNEQGQLYITDYERKRLTAGFTFSITKPFIADLRINYEKYFYNDNAEIKVSEQDKIVAEVMVRF